ncbi:MAG: hypothetical protein MRJ68_18195 [Nitrospira sp.]|nr:hypothetical protein [Nitrospira sp.]
MKSSTPLVQKHRAKMTLEGLGRMEVTLSRKFIDQARELARRRKVPFWYFLERAIVAYATVSGNDSRAGGGNRSNQHG